jgi:hypothetical protein
MVPIDVDGDPVRVMQPVAHDDLEEPEGPVGRDESGVSAVEQELHGMLEVVEVRLSDQRGVLPSIV